MMWNKIKKAIKEILNLTTSFPAIPCDPLMCHELSTYSESPSMGDILPVGSGEPTCEELGIEGMIPFKIEEMSFNSQDAGISKEFFGMAKEYILEQLKKGIHPDEIEFNMIDLIADILDRYSTDEDGNRVNFEKSEYWSQK